MSKELAVAEPKNEVAIIFDKINAGLEAFESRKETLTVLKSKAEGLKIESIEDKHTINQVSAIRKELKKARVEIENEGKAMRDPLTKISKSISAKENELVSIIEPTEKSLLVQEKWVKDEEARIAAEEKRKEDERVQKRIDRLAEFGVGIDLTYVTVLSDEQFEGVVNNARIEHEKDQAAKAEQARQEQAQRDQDEKDRAELKALGEKQESADKILKERQDELDRQERELKRKQDQAAEARTQGRSSQLKALGMIYDRIIGGGSYNYDDVSVAVDPSIVNLNDDEWNTLLSEVSESVSISKKDAHDRRVAEEERIRKEAAEKALADQKEKDVEQARQETERIAQASDKEKFSTIVSQIEALSYPEMKSAKHKKLLTEVKDLQAKIIAHIKSKS